MSDDDNSKFDTKKKREQDFKDELSKRIILKSNDYFSMRTIPDAPPSRTTPKTGNENYYYFSTKVIQDALSSWTIPKIDYQYFNYIRRLGWSQDAPSEWTITKEQVEEIHERNPEMCEYLNLD